MRPEKNAGGVERRIGENVSRKDKVNFLVNTVSIILVKFFSFFKKSNGCIF